MHLNVFERLWAAWYAYLQNDVLATGIMSFVMHEVVYFGRSLPWFIIDHIPRFNKYKIQNVRRQSRDPLIEWVADNFAAKNTDTSRAVAMC